MATALECPSCGGALDPEARACPHCGSVALSRRCAVCFDLNLVDDRNCRRCGARLPDENPEARPERLACPGCSSAMTPRRSGAASFDECDACGGMWLSPGTSQGMASEAETRAQLRAFDRHAKAAPAAGPPVQYRRCPLCRKMMNRAQYARGSGVVVDLCKNHGTYYDRGELARIFTFIESGGLEQARRREAESLREDLRDLKRQAAAARAGADLSVTEESAAFQGGGAFDLIRWIADYLGGNRSENSG